MHARRKLFVINAAILALFVLGYLVSRFWLDGAFAWRSDRVPSNILMLYSLLFCAYFAMATFAYGPWEGRGTMAPRHKLVIVTLVVPVIWTVAYFVLAWLDQFSFAQDYPQQIGEYLVPVGGVYCIYLPIFLLLYKPGANSWEKRISIFLKVVVGGAIVLLAIGYLLADLYFTHLY